MTAHRQPVDGVTARVVFVDVDVRCSACYEIIPSGEILLAGNDPARPYLHEPRCPSTWKPRLIAGGADDSPAETVQLVLPMLQAVHR